MAATHRRTRAIRWKSAGTLMLIPLLISASGGTLQAATVAENAVIPSVPTKPYDKPASVQPGIDISASPVTAAVADVAANDIPAAALMAYRRTETLLSDSDPQCKLAWTLVAAIGRVESNHGRTGGNTLDADGVARPGIFGIPLDGSNNTATISDTDGGKFDKDESWDRAVGPMQFIPGTWTSVAIDSDNDGKSDPQNIVDASASAGVYLCAGVDDLSTDKGARSAVHRYNHSDSYVNKVLAIAGQYADGTFTDPPSVLFAGPPTQTALVPMAPVEAEPEVTKPDEPAPTPTPGTKPKPAPGTTPTTPTSPGTPTTPGTTPTTPTTPGTTPDTTPTTPTTPGTTPTTSGTTSTPTPEPTPSSTPAPTPSSTPPATPIPTPSPTATSPLPARFTGTEAQARELCLVTGRFAVGSVEMEQCVVTLMQSGYLPPATPPGP